MKFADHRLNITGAMWSRSIHYQTLAFGLVIRMCNSSGGRVFERLQGRALNTIARSVSTSGHLVSLLGYDKDLVANVISCKFPFTFAAAISGSIDTSIPRVMQFLSKPNCLHFSYLHQSRHTVNFHPRSAVVE